MSDGRAEPRGQQSFKFAIVRRAARQSTGVMSSAVFREIEQPIQGFEHRVHLTRSVLSRISSKKQLKVGIAAGFFRGLRHKAESLVRLVPKRGSHLPLAADRMSVSGNTMIHRPHRRNQRTKTEILYALPSTANRFVAIHSV